MSDYATIREIVEDYRISERTVRKRLSDMQRHVGKEYLESALIKDGKLVRVNREAFAHFCNHRREMRE